MRPRVRVYNEPFTETHLKVQKFNKQSRLSRYSIVELQSVAIKCQSLKGLYLHITL
jgi:hypothetical protein